MIMVVLVLCSATGTPSMAPQMRHNIAGPLCFGGDLVGREVLLPTIDRGNFVVIHDCGANTLSLFSRHCSRPAPAVYGYRQDLSIVLLKNRESLESVLEFWS